MFVGRPLFAQSYVDYVDPLIGTLSSFELSAGNTYPVIGLPWGMNSWTPMTGVPGDGWQYTYGTQDSRIQTDPPTQSLDQRLRPILPSSPYGTAEAIIERLHSSD